MKKILVLLLSLCMFAACSQKQEEKKHTLAINDLGNEYVETYYDTYLQDVLDSDLYTMFSIEPNQLLQYVYKEAFLDVRCDMLVMLQVSGDVDIEAIRTVLEKEKQKQVDEFANYIPEVSEIAKKAIIYSNENYIFLIMNEHADEIVKDIQLQFNEE